MSDERIRKLDSSWRVLVVFSIIGLWITLVMTVAVNNIQNKRILELHSRIDMLELKADREPTP